MAYVILTSAGTLQLTFDGRNFERDRLAIPLFKALRKVEWKYDGNVNWWTFPTARLDYIIDCYRDLTWLLVITPQGMVLHKDGSQVAIPVQSQTHGSHVSTPSAAMVWWQLNDMIKGHANARSWVFKLHELVDYAAFANYTDGRTPMPPRTPRIPPAPKPPPARKREPKAVYVRPADAVREVGELHIARIGKFVQGAAKFAVVGAPLDLAGYVQALALEVYGQELENRELHQLSAPTLDASTFYSALGMEPLDPRALYGNTLRKFYYKQAQIYHPDRNRASNATAMMQAVNRAYEVLSGALDPNNTGAAVAKWDQDHKIKRGRVQVHLIKPATTMNAAIAKMIKSGTFTCEFYKWTTEGGDTRYEVVSVSDVQPLRETEFA